MSDSPLVGANPDSISELFARDPQSWSDADMERMIAHYRELRAKLASNQAPEKKAKPAKIAAADVTLESLGLA